MWQLARLCAHVGAGAVPDAVYYMFVSGCLTALNKVSEEEQRHLLLTVGERKIRPVNSGAAILKVTLHIDMVDKSTRRAVNDQRPIQMGEG